MKRVGLVMVNYKDYAKNYLAACRDSLRAQDYPAEAVSVYLVDNASTPESLAYLRSAYPEAMVIPRPDGNYCAANNAGASKALADGCQYLVFLNLDVEAEPGWLSGLVQSLEDNPGAGLAQSKILLFPRSETEKQKPRINSLGNVVHYLGFGYTSGYGLPDRGIAGYPEIPGYGSGCSLVIRADVFQAIGGYDEEYYMYHDDMYLSLLAKLAGWSVILAPASRLYHKYEFSRSTRMVYYMERNRRLLAFSFFPSRLLLLASPLAFVMEAGLLFASIPGGWFRSEVRSLAYFLNPRTWQSILLKRKQIKAATQVSFSGLAKDFAGKIEFQEVDGLALRLANPVLAWYWRLIRRFVI